MAKKSFISKLFRDFTASDDRSFKIKLGYTIASSLTGIIVGVIISSVIWYQALDYAVQLAKDICLGN
jgi:acid phosphatase family membrane protein YuiD